LRSFSFLIGSIRVIPPTVLILTAAISAGAQSSSSPAPPTNTPSPTASQPANSPATSPAKPESSAVTVQANQPPGNEAPVSTSEDAPQVNPAIRRIERARALAAAHQLQQAATDLENIRVSVNDLALRNVTSLMLVGIYIEEGNYARAQVLLEESFVARGAQKDESIRTYFAMVGQTLNGVRAHLARYRSFGINPSAIDLPAEANTDIERIRGLLERVIAQAKEVTTEAGRSYDALALQEDVLGLRLTLARDNNDRDKWQAEYVAVREKMASSQIQVASIGRSTALDALTARIPNPFSTKPSSPSESSDNTNTEANQSSASSASSAPTNAKAGAPEPQLISSGSLHGKEIKRVTPSYPSLARTTGVSGMVRVFAIVDETGKVWVTNSEGPTLLRRAAEEAAKGWSFPPTLVSGKPVRVAGYLDFDFKL
jgi:TonB family protein